SVMPCAPTTSTPSTCAPSTVTSCVVSELSPGSPNRSACSLKQLPTTATWNALIVNHTAEVLTAPDEPHLNVTGAGFALGEPKMVIALRPASFAGYVPGATVTVSPGCAMVYAFWKVLHGLDPTPLTHVASSPVLER